MFACLFLGARVLPLQAAVVPENRPALEKVFHHPDLFVREHQEKVAELSSTLQSAVAGDLVKLGVQSDLGFYDSRVGRFSSLVLREPLIPGTGKGKTLRWEGLGRATDTDIQVTLSEIRPDGQETYVQSGWLRASRRVLDRARA